MTNTTKTPAPSFAADVVADAVKLADDINRYDAQAWQLEHECLELMEIVPNSDCPAGQLRRKLSELADAYQQLAHSYKIIADV